jgi:hypothetical protein
MKGAKSKKTMEEKILSVKRTKVAILGTVPHKLMAPFNDLSFDIWAIAHACLGDPLPRVDRIFEIHKEDEWRKYQSALAWQNHPDVPVYMQKVFSDVPNSIPFPYDDLIAKFKIFDDRAEVNFTNSISEMMAMAIDEGYKEIHIYGVNMSHHTEYGTQKPSCEYYLGLAKGMGIKIYVPSVSDLIKTNFIYGRDEEEQALMIAKMEERMSFLNQQLNTYQAQANQVQAAIQQHLGAIEDCKFWLQHFRQ